MKRILKLNENQFTNLIKKIIYEAEIEKMSDENMSDEFEKHLAIDFVTSDNPREKEMIMKRAKKMDFDLFKKYVIRFKI